MAWAHCSNTKRLPNFRQKASAGRNVVLRFNIFCCVFKTAGRATNELLAVAGRNGDSSHLVSVRSTGTILRSSKWTNLRTLSGKGLAGYIGMPVHKCSVRVLLPRPNMQGIERRETETIRALEIMEKLSLELGRLSWMSFIPRIGKKKVVGADQAQASAG